MSDFTPSQATATPFSNGGTPSASPSPPARRRSAHHPPPRRLPTPAHQTQTQTRKRERDATRVAGGHSMYEDDEYCDVDMEDPVATGDVDGDGDIAAAAAAAASIGGGGNPAPPSAAGAIAGVPFYPRLGADDLAGL